MTEPTIFHKIIAGEIPCETVYETEEVLAFKDVHPKAPTHILFVAKKEEHFASSIMDLTDATQHVPCMLIRSAQEFAKQKGIDGYKLTFHCGAKGGQEVFFLHLHFMSQETIESS
jgi:histidine triad (HIT) family protein